MKRIALALILLALCDASRAQFLIVTATGTVTSDSDASNTFGFGVSPTASGVSTAAGQSVVMTFVLNLSRTPTNVCANNACFPSLRGDYFANTVPATGWITTTDSIGGNTVPEFAPNGGNVGLPGTSSTNPYGSSVASAQTWLQGDSAGPYNELDLQSTQVVQTTGANGAYAASTETSFLRIDDATAAPFLSSLSLDQNFSWSSSLDDGLSIAQIYRAVTVGACSTGQCTGNQIVDAEANVSLKSVTGTIVSTPEIDPMTAASGLALLLGSVLVLRGRREASVPRC
jgi:hypothetical protein